jgi:hypothetical protein
MPVDEGKCGTFGPADCQAGELCRLAGLCSFVEGRCEVASEADCQRTEGCERTGTCTFIADTGKSAQRKSPGCIIGSDADCRRSVACKEHGACRKGKGVARTGPGVICVR